jgi:predicted transport protein
MSSLDKATQTQLDNIQKKTGKSLEELTAIVRKSGLTKHGEIRDYLKRELGLGHGDANALVHAILQSDGQRAAEGKSTDLVLDEIYSGAKAHMRPIHEKLMKEIKEFGEFEIAPKKGYVSLRRKKQFAMIGPKTNTRFEVGINANELKKNARLLEQPKGSMCNYIVNLTDVNEVNPELIAWIKSAYEGAG